MDRELVDAFILECKQEQEWKERCKANFIELDNYFKYSGEVEEDTEEWKEFIEAQKYANIKAPPLIKVRSDYFRIYWLKLKNKKL
tara:strand:+ start:31 stop:285 length:255 start_codon:yes stop_codon:yes gene_type:complete